MENSDISNDSAKLEGSNEDSIGTLDVENILIKQEILEDMVKNEAEVDIKEDPLDEDYQQETAAIKEEAPVIKEEPVDSDYSAMDPLQGLFQEEEEETALGVHSLISYSSLKDQESSDGTKILNVNPVATLGVANQPRVENENSTIVKKRRGRPPKKSKSR